MTHPLATYYQQILIGDAGTASGLPRHRWSTWMAAIFWSVRVLRAFDTGGSVAAEVLLQRVRLRSTSHSCIHQLPDAVQMYSLRCDCACLRGWLHALMDARACFAESFALCAGLRCLGWDCDLIVGYACVEVFTTAPMHAWVAFHDLPVSDPLDILYGYTEIYRSHRSQEARDVQ